MSIGGKKREDNGANVEFVKSVGIFEGEVVAINPDKEELGALLGKEVEKDPEYVKVTKEGDDAVSIVYWIREVLSKDLYQARFWLVNKERENQAKTKTQYINLTGSTTWADSPNSLDEKFKAYDYQKANIGDEEHYDFLRAWLNQLDWRTNEEFLNNKKLYKGNVKELRDLMKSEYVGTVVAMATVVNREVDVDGKKETKQYQNVYNRKFLPGNTIKFFQTKSKKYPKMVQYFLDHVTDKDYGCKDHYSLELLHEFEGTPAPTENKPKKQVSEDESAY